MRYGNDDPLNESVRSALFGAVALASLARKGMTEKIRIGDSDVLLVVDIQNDFCPGGALPVRGGDEIVPLVNRLGASFPHVLLTQDWHPPGHLSFASSHPGMRPFETVALDYGPQILWPDHCVQGRAGAD
jgi:nicotinamidase/pyrazinamidase